MADCTQPSRIEAHCELVGRGLMALDGNPDGHCEVNGVCPRCQLAAAEPEPAAVPAEAAAAEPTAPEATPAVSEPEPTPPSS